MARLARIQIVAQVKEPDRFWTADSSTQSRVIEAIVKTGAKAILTWPEATPCFSRKPVAKTRKQQLLHALTERGSMVNYHYCHVSAVAG